MASTSAIKSYHESAVSLGERAFGRGQWAVLAPLGISDCRSHISDLRFEICHLKSQRACPRPHSRSPRLAFRSVFLQSRKLFVPEQRLAPSRWKRISYGSEGGLPSKPKASTLNGSN